MLKIRSQFWHRDRIARYSHYATEARIFTLRQLLLQLLLLAGLHVGAMMYFEGLTLGDAIWLTTTTLTTVGYGDLSAQSTGGRVATMILLYGFGIFLLAQIAGEWIDFRKDRWFKMRMGLWRWKMKDHIVIINTPPQGSTRYLQMLIQQIRNSESLRSFPIQILTDDYPEGLPDEIAKQGVVLRHGEPEGVQSLAELDVDSALFILVLCDDPSEYKSDSVTLDILDQLKVHNPPGYIIAECIQDDNRQRFRNHGANAVIRPVRAYPELIVRAMAAPGTEAILEDLFQHEGVHTRRYDMIIDGQKWGELASRVLLAGLGTPLGYISKDGILVTNPRADSTVTAMAIFILVNSDHIPSEQAVEECVKF